MTKAELQEIIKADPYHKERLSPTEPEIRLYLREVDYHCPLCGKELQHKKQKKNTQKLFQIAHIYPNSPTIEQYHNFKDLPRLGNNSESFENKIALCLECHPTQDYHTTADEYMALIEIKKKCLLQTDLDSVVRDLSLEEQIASVLLALTRVSDEELSSLSFDPQALSNKFYAHESAIKRKVKNYVLDYFVFIRKTLTVMDGINGFHQSILASQIRSCFIKMSDHTDDKELIFQHIVQWVKTKTLSTSDIACEAVVSFFVQNCEVFNEITE